MEKLPQHPVVFVHFALNFLNIVLMIVLKKSSSILALFDKKAPETTPHGVESLQTFQKNQTNVPLKKS